MGKQQKPQSKQPAVKVKPKLKGQSPNQTSSKPPTDHTYVKTKDTQSISKLKPQDTSHYSKISLKDNLTINRPVVDNTYVYHPNRSLVGTGGLKLQLKNGPPEFKGYIIFVNGFWGDPVKNTGAVAWNSLMDKVPERGDKWSMKGAENTNEKDLSDDDDRYTPEEFKKDGGQTTPEKTTLMKALKEGVKNGIIPGRAIYKYFHATKYQRYVKYWNVEQNNYAFTEAYSNYFDAKNNVHYINGSHGLESSPVHRMDHGLKQGEAWAKLNLQYLDKTTYDKFAQYMPSLGSPEYNPITIVMHSQGNAMGVGVAKGILKHLANLKWDKAAINMVYLALHQNKGFTKATYDTYTATKLDMLANQHLKASLAEFFERRKLYIARGIDEYAAGGFISNWNKLKTRGVQFTFANDRADVVSRMGDIPGIANACNDDQDNVTLMPFELEKERRSYRIYSKRILNKLLKVDKIKNGKVIIDQGATKYYTDLVAAYAKAYYIYKDKLAYFNAHPDERYSNYGTTTVGIGAPVSASSQYDNLSPYKKAVSDAYSSLFDAELEAHSGPTAWGLNEEVCEWANGKSVFQLIKDKGANIFYRKSNKKANLLLNPSTVL